MKAKILKLHNAVFDLNKVIYIEAVQARLNFFFESGQKISYEFATETDVETILNKCYDIMKQ